MIFWATRSKQIMASDSPGDHQNYLGPDNGEMNAPGAPAGNLFITVE